MTVPRIRFVVAILNVDPRNGDVETYFPHISP
jgi:hypothetical protein